jgi:hypothetical protein
MGEVAAIGMDDDAEEPDDEDVSVEVDLRRTIRALERA